jgi:hypothetical protein
MDALFELVCRSIYRIAETGLLCLQQPDDHDIITSELPFSNDIAVQGDGEPQMEWSSILGDCEDEQYFQIGILAVS